MPDRIALVTGAGKGLGWETSRRLGALGMTVFAGARDPQRGREAAETLRAGGADARFVPLDVTSERSVRQARDVIDASCGRLDVLVNNAGVSPEQEPGIRGVPTAVPAGLLRQTYEVNVFGVATVTRLMLPLLLRSAAARIVNVSTTMGSLTAWADPDSPQRRYAPMLLAYDSSKAALNALTLHHAAQLAGTTVTVNSASPGYVATDLNGHRGTLQLGDEGSVSVIVRLATAGADGPTGAFVSDDGPAAW
ncbi:MAG: SDR family NAD(P)-dependent oxidoreductase [Nocardiopsaceae bacterium]|jgi:NAD(P)-dependent dehydrogenase (short-subunit alcohol dehydrogenase family)|nr:SDR family NAD(P)-dependent oxidoreductase [Nocardiopsaceae bacterium]